MSKQFHYHIKRIRFDENYQPSDSTRITTNFANLARGEHRQENLRKALRMIDSRLNALAHWDNPNGERYQIELDIVSVDIDVEGRGDHFPSIEILQTHILDRVAGKRLAGIVGNNLSSYVRDYDFSVLLREYNQNRAGFSVPEQFGDLHGKLFQDFIHSDTYKQHFNKPPVICLSVSDNKIYQRSANQHPVLGVEYLPNESSLTEQYFKRMGLNVRYFMPPNSVAPLAFYFFGDLLSDYTNLELIGTISTMETFQRIYRPEIYNANSVAGDHYQPDLTHPDHSLTQITYDREERSQLAIKQGKFAEEHFIKPYQRILKEWSANWA
ncbi:hypothetical protein CHH28_08535 [Bacterioplanes sanyensis]|uniref:DUF1852 domain-containing protein n=1 Tax=Bacterioplanes sanyensis TaxID=1249553 RepID=A0A222FKG3_9GAMM|nr:DUF1852 domain-containing protein [Bacterioplanes sanyensis]ASP38723.1 hypothetical protein CHH28_08535 [Bacterioplanes sanyensis]